MRKIMVLVLGALLVTVCQLALPKPMVPPVQQTGGPSGCSGAIYGKVGVAEVYVQLSEGGTATQSTGSDGRYIFTRLTPGTYRIEIHGPGDYKALSPTVVSVNLAETCSVVEVDFELAAPAPIIIAPAAVPSAPITAPSSTGHGTTSNLLDEVRKLWPRAELPVKETMFLAGKLLIGPLSSLLGCLRIFGYLFAVVYCLVAIQWQINHRGTSWQEFMDDFLLGAPGKMLFIVSIIAAPVVYLTALHDFAEALWLTDNSYMREALGWKLIGFSPDLDPESMVELLKWLPEWVALHGAHEIMLMVGFVLAVILAGLRRNLGPLRIWGVAYLMYALYGLAVYTSVVFVDSVRGADVVGNNLVWSSFVRINKMFVASTKGLWYLMAYIIPGFYAIYEMFFASRGTRPARPASATTSQDLLNAFQTLAIWLGLINRPPATAPGEGGAWPMGAQYPANNPRLGSGGGMLPDGQERNLPPQDKRPGGGKPDGDLRTDTQSSPRAQSGAVNSVPPLPATDSNNMRGGSGQPIQSKWTIEPPATSERVAEKPAKDDQPDGLVQIPPAGNDDKTIPDNPVQESAAILVAPTNSSTVNDARIPSDDQRALPDTDDTTTASRRGAAATDSSVDKPNKIKGSETPFQSARMKGKFGDLEEDELILIKISDGKAQTVDGTVIPLESLALEPNQGGEG